MGFNLPCCVIINKRHFPVLVTFYLLSHFALLGFPSSKEQIPKHTSDRTKTLLTTMHIYTICTSLLLFWWFRENIFALEPNSFTGVTGDDRSLNERSWYGKRKRKEERRCHHKERLFLSGGEAKHRLKTDICLIAGLMITIDWQMIPLPFCCKC